jgi:hypothetical protein
MGGLGTCRSRIEQNLSSRRSAPTVVALSLMTMLLGACQVPDQTTAAATRTVGPTVGHASASPATQNSTTKAWTPGNLASLGKNGTMIGVADRELAAALGEPSQVRRDEPAEIWQYRGQECVLDFYLYRANAGLQVTYVEARDRHAQAEGTDKCVKSMMQPTTAAFDKANIQKTADASE